MDCTELRAEVSRNHGVVEVAFVGEVDLTSATLIRDALDEAVNAGAALVVLDFTRLTFMDSTGIHCLVRALAIGEAVGCRVVVRNANGMVRRVLELTGVAELLLETTDPTMRERRCEGIEL